MYPTRSLLRLRSVLSNNYDLWTYCLIWRRVGQVIAPLFIVQRVANKNELTGGAIVISSLNFRNRGQSTGDSVLPGGGPVDSMNDRESGAEAEIITVPHQDAA